MSFSAMGLADCVVKATDASGYHTPTEIQQKAIPLALDGRDIIGCAPTGTGKTAAFVLPILNRLILSARTGRDGLGPRALVLTPTRELAQQIEDAVATYGAYTTIRATSVYGGINIQRQLQVLRRGVDILIATPGRLLDHIERGSINLSRVEVLVIDEADRMYDMGFIRDVRRIVGRVPAQRQTLLFSATMSPETRSLVAAVQTDPQRIDVGAPNTAVTTVDQHFYAVSSRAKLDLLVHVLGNEQVETMLVFSRTKRGAERIARNLERRGLQCGVIHSNRTQAQRQHALDGFKARRHRILVATDIAARGIDIDRISHVVNYDTPVFAEDYVHRIGRTGRAEAGGRALTFVSTDEEKFLRKIALFTTNGSKLKHYPGFTDPEPPLLTPLTGERPMAYGRGRRSFRRRVPRFA
jgi:ATP-dependent RNA helicase RhlE